MNAETKAYLDAQFAELKAGKEETVTLDKRGNQRQFDHAKRVLTRLESARKLIRGSKPEAAVCSINDAMEEVKKRIKVIKLADKKGWDTAEAYMSDDLASDSEDEKRIKKAEAEAEKKRKKRQNEFNAKRRRGSSQAGPSQYGFGASHYPSSDLPGPSHFAAPQFFPVSTRGQFFRAPLRGNGYRWASRCFACGKEGHYRNFSPLLQQTQPKLIPVLGSQAPASSTSHQA